MSSQILNVSNLEVFYGASQILFGVSFSVAEGQTLALLGRNGAGKSTTMKSISGLIVPRAGEVLMGGENVTGKKPHFVARSGIGFVPEDRQVFPEHSVVDNLVIAAKKGTQGEDYWNLRQVYQMFPLLEPLKNRLAGNLSGGEQQMLTIARTLMGNPTVILLDEPSEGLAPVIVERIGDLIRKLSDLGSTVVLAEQNMPFCLDIASHAAVIDKGKIVFSDTIASLKDNREITDKYLAI